MITILLEDSNIVVLLIIKVNDYKIAMEKTVIEKYFRKHLKIEL